MAKLHAKVGIIGAGPAEFRPFIRAEQKKYEKVVKDANIRVE